MAHDLEMLKGEDAISIILFYCEERKIEEIAKYLNCSLSAAYKRIERALVKMRVFMNALPPPKK